MPPLREDFGNSPSLPMDRLTSRVGAGPEGTDLRLRIIELRQALNETTVAYRQAAARHDSSQSIGLLRSRSRLMRELLDAQCNLLLSLRSAPSGAECEVVQIQP